MMSYSQPSERARRIRYDRYFSYVLALASTYVRCCLLACLAMDLSLYITTSSNSSGCDVVTIIFIIFSPVYTTCMCNYDL
jgi:hypothetical protein